MRLYHGTNKEFLEIDLLKSKPLIPQHFDLTLFISS